jgi:hypothetical protein
MWEWFTLKTSGVVDPAGIVYDEGMSKKPATNPAPPDGRGSRPTDPNELASWIVSQTTGQGGHGEKTAHGH